ncbi:MFS transporter [Streptomyces sp. NPDC096142]|uniref:MFS transporter n=1 Tax=Streptomyces sp. NPDC096142 TaxID=3366077 RepID=UPI0037FE2013
MTTDTDIPPASRNWWALGSMGLAQLLVTLDIMVVNVALPAVQKDLEFSDTNRSWVLTSYTLAFASLMLFSGRLADRFGRRRVFVTGLVGFAAASALGAAATTFGALIAARAVQGVFAALLAPTALALVAVTFPTGRARARAFGAFGAFGTISMAGGTIGLILGGILTQFLNWRWTMLIGVIFAAMAVVGALAFIDRDHETRPVRIDPLSVLSVSPGLLCLVLGFTEAGEQSWSAAATLVPLALGALLIAVFVLRQTRIPAPLLPLRLLADRTRAASVIGVFLSMAGQLSAVYFGMAYVQDVLGWSAVATGIAFLPQPMSTALASLVIGPRLGRRMGPANLIPAALVLGAGGALLLSSVTTHSPYAGTVLPGLVLIGLSGGLFFPTANALSTRGIAPGEIGVGSAVVSTSQHTGGTLGIAIVSTAASLARSGYAHGHHINTAATSAVLSGLVAAFQWTAVIFAIGTLITALALRGTSLDHT